MAWSAGKSSLSRKTFTSSLLASDINNTLSSATETQYIIKWDNGVKHWQEQLVPACAVALRGSPLGNRFKSSTTPYLPLIYSSSSSILSSFSFHIFYEDPLIFSSSTRKNSEGWLVNRFSLLRPLLVLLCLFPTPITILLPSRTWNYVYLRKQGICWRSRPSSSCMRSRGI